MGKPVKKQNSEKSLKRKQRSLEREKQRSLDLTRGFVTLHKCLPDFVPSNLPKIKILRLAARYIEYLESMLQPEKYNPFNQAPPLEDFFHTATKEIMARNCYTEAIRKELEGNHLQSKSCPRLPETAIHFPKMSPPIPPPVPFSFWTPQIAPFENNLSMYSPEASSSTCSSISPSNPPISHLLPDIGQTSTQEWTFHDLSVSYNV